MLTDGDRALCEGKVKALVQRMREGKDVTATTTLVEGTAAALLLQADEAERARHLLAAITTANPPALHRRKGA